MMVGSVGSLGFAVDTAVCFSDHKGRPKNGIEKRQMKLLEKAAPLLRAVLRPGETVLLAAPACSPMSLMEQWTTGWVIYYLKRCLLVVTDRRILELAVRRDLSPRGSVVEIDHGGVVQAKVSSFFSRSLALRYFRGGGDVFPQLDGKAAAKLKALLPSLTGKGTAAHEGRQHLCPRCLGRLHSVDRCPQCFLEFKTRAQATRYALLFPGGGYFYTGHPVLGTLDALVEGFLLILLLIALFDTVTAGGVENLSGVIAVTAFLAFEKALSVYHAQHYIKGFLPVESDITPTRAA
jgi:hypothetical protein